MKKNNYYVIGGQYASFCHGGAPTLTGAKRIASNNTEYWDNWQGWHVPVIYRAEDVRKVNNFFGDQWTPIDGAYPVAVAEHRANGRHVWEVRKNA